MDIESKPKSYRRPDGGRNPRLNIKKMTQTSRNKVAYTGKSKDFKSVAHGDSMCHISGLVLT